MSERNMTKIADFALAHKGLLAAGSLLCLLQSASSIASSAQLGRLLDAALGDRDRLAENIAAAMLLLLFSMAVEFIAKDAKLRFANAASRDCTTTLLRRLFARPNPSEEDAAGHVNLLYQDQDILYADFFSMLCELVQFGSTVLLALLFLLLVHPLLAGIGALSACLSLALNRSFGKPLDRSQSELSASNASLLRQAGEALQGYDTLKGSGADGRFLRSLGQTRAAAVRSFGS